jgi:transketolase
MIIKFYFISFHFTYQFLHHHHHHHPTMYKCIKRTPGHPESHITEGIEVTTGPLGQGFANAVGLALAQSQLEATYSSEDTRVFDSFTYVLLGDGCMQEGVAAEAASLAGHWRLGKLIALYDDNRISIDGDTELSFTEDVMARFQAYGFHCLSVEDGDGDLDAIDEAITAAKAVKDAPSLIRIRTTIGKGSVAVQGTEKAHGAPLGSAELRKVKEAFGFVPDESFVIPAAVRQLYSEVAARGTALHASWNGLLASHPARPEIERRFAGALPADLSTLLPRFQSSDGPQATRKLSEGVLNVLGPLLPELSGGSADLTSSNLTFWRDAQDYQHFSRQGRYLRFGVREHGMLAIVNGMAAFGGFLPFGATFLNFITYGWGAVRLTALSHLRALFIMTHDSIGLGEDGPTHQPVEVLAALRALPNLLTLRPADGNEVSGAYLAALKETSRPAVLCLSRQNLPQLPGSSVEGVLRGGYILRDFASPTREAHSATLRPVILIATGSEVSLACEVADLLQGSADARVVSLPCWELFREQGEGYRGSVLPARIPVLAIEAGSVQGWLEWADACVGIEGFGWSGPAGKVYARVGLEASAIVPKVMSLIDNYF